MDPYGENSRLSLCLGRLIIGSTVRGLWPCRRDCGGRVCSQVSGGTPALRGPVKLWLISRCVDLPLTDCYRFGRRWPRRRAAIAQSANSSIPVKKPNPVAASDVRSSRRVSTDQKRSCRASTWARATEVTAAAIRQPDSEQIQRKTRSRQRIHTSAAGIAFPPVAAPTSMTRVAINAARSPIPPVSNVTRMRTRACPKFASPGATIATC